MDETFHDQSVPDLFPVHRWVGGSSFCTICIHRAFSQRPFVYDRLDSITSGVLLCAKSKESAGEMGALFESNSVHKYVFLYCFFAHMYTYIQT